MTLRIVKPARLFVLVMFAATLLNDCTLQKKAERPKRTKENYVLTNQILIGRSSWYGKPFHGRKTASGERFNMFAMTAAHKTLPLGTFLQVRNLNNNKTVIVKVNDRGPYIHGRILDLSFGAAEKLEFTRNGVATVEARVVKKIEKSKAPSEKIARSAALVTSIDKKVNTN